MAIVRRGSSTARLRLARVRWLSAWRDLVAFEVIPVITSAEAMKAISPRL
jgi:hypothetical protein